MNIQIIRSINPTKESTRKISPWKIATLPTQGRICWGQSSGGGRGNFKRENFSVTQKDWYYENLSLFLSLKTLLTFYKSFGRPNFNSWKNISLSASKLKQKLPNIEQLLLLLVIKLTILRVIFFIKSLFWNPWQVQDGLVSNFSSINGLLPSYLQSYLNHCNEGECQMGSRWQNKMKALSGRTFDSSFYPCCIEKWCTLSEEFWNTVSVNEFKAIILKHNTNGFKLPTHLRLNFSHLNEYKFRRGFSDTVDPVCKCSLEIEALLNFLLRCSLYSCIRTGLLNGYIYLSPATLLKKRLWHR